MSVPTRPVSHAAIASVWGQAVHDWTFAPAGAKVHGVVGTNLGTSYSKMSLSIADDDPGGYLDAANNRIEVPTGGDGLYNVFAVINTVNGSAGAGNATRTKLTLNGTEVATGKEDNNGGTNVTLVVPWVGVLSAGDLLELYSQKINSGTNPDVQVLSFVLYRVGADFGSP